jgi:hypothetical protein
MGESEDSQPVNSQPSSPKENTLFEKVENLISDAQNSLQENLNLRRLLEESESLNKRLESHMQALQLSSDRTAQFEHRLLSQLQHAESESEHGRTSYLPLQSSSVPNLHTTSVAQSHASHANPNFASSAVRSGTIPGLGVDFESNN